LKSFHNYLSEDFVPDVEQKADDTCGVACVMSIITQYRGRARMINWEGYLAKELHTTEKHGTSPEMIVGYLNTVGIQAEPCWGVTVEHLQQLLEYGPVICLVQEPYAKDGKNGHWVVVEKVVDGRVWFMDPWPGLEESVSCDDFERNWFDDTVITNFPTYHFCIRITRQ